MIQFDLSEYSRLSEDDYKKERRKLLIELVKLQEWVIKKKKRIAIVYEGRDAAGKTGSISVLSRYLIPQKYNVVHLGKPTKYESRHWFARYAKHLPNRGEIVFFDRSWYTRALTEVTMGYCTKRQYTYFMNHVLEWERGFQKKGVQFLKFYLSINKPIQKERLDQRASSPLVYWKITENDLRMVEKWDIYTLYKNQMFERTTSKKAPWVILNSNNKKIAHLNALRYILQNFEYTGKSVPQPTALTRGLNNYDVTVDGTTFNNLSYKQFKKLRQLAAGEK